MAHNENNVQGALLEVRNLRTSFFTQNGEVRAVNDVSFHVDRQEVVVTGTMSHGWLVADAVEAAADAEEMDNGETTENREQA